MEDDHVMGLRSLLTYVLGVLSRIAALTLLRVFCALVSIILLAHLVITFFGRALLPLGMELSAFLVFAAVAAGAVSRVVSRARNACEEKPLDEETTDEIAAKEPAGSAQKENAEPGHPRSLPEEPAGEPAPTQRGQVFIVSLMRP